MTGQYSSTADASWRMGAEGGLIDRDVVTVVAVREDTSSGGRSVPAAMYSDHRVSLQDDGTVQRADGGVLSGALVK